MLSEALHTKHGKQSHNTITVNGTESQKPWTTTRFIRGDVQTTVRLMANRSCVCIEMYCVCFMLSTNGRPTSMSNNNFYNLFYTWVTCRSVPVCDLHWKCKHKTRNWKKVNDERWCGRDKRTQSGSDKGGRCDYRYRQVWNVSRSDWTKVKSLSKVHVVVSNTPGIYSHVRCYECFNAFALACVCVCLRVCARVRVRVRVRA